MPTDELNGFSKRTLSGGDHCSLFWRTTVALPTGTETELLTRTAG